MRQVAVEHFNCNNNHLVTISDEFGTTYADGGKDRTIVFGVEGDDASTVTLLWSHVNQEVCKVAHHWA